MKTNDKQKIQFTCCNFVAFGFRGTHRSGGEIYNFAQCPKCGKRHNISKWEKK